MFDRPEFIRPEVREFKQVKVALDQTPEAFFKSWLAGLTATPRYCGTHRRTQLVLNHRNTRFRPVYADWEQRRPKPGEFEFHAVYICRSCCVAYARCPPEFHETSFDTFDASTPERAAALAKAREFVAQVNKHSCGFALFVGPPGTGKTRLTSNVVRELEVRNALYVRQSELTCALRTTYGHKDVFLYPSRRRDDDEDDGCPESPSPLEIVQEIAFLVLDEMGCTALANDERLFLDELLKHRYDHRKPTILISNLPLTGMADSLGLKELLGDALTDRVRDATGNGKFIVQFTGESYRRTTGENYLHGIL